MIAWQLRAAAACVAGLAVGATSLVAQGAAKPCTLVLPAELATIGVPPAARNTFDDDVVSIKPGQIPGITTALRMAQCTTSYETFGAFPARWSVLTTADPMTKARWTALNKALDDDDDRQASPDDEQMVVGGVDCERLSYLAEKGKRVHALACYGFRGTHAVTLEVAAAQKAQLPAPLVIKQQLDRMLARL